MVILGIDPLRAYAYTPHEIFLIAKQLKERQTTELERLVTLAWHTEAFARTKRLPRLDKTLKAIRNPKKHNTKSDIILRKMAADKGVEV